MPDLKKDIEEKILDAAFKIFSRKGLMGARMTEIAKEAEITRASLNYYFRSKEQLYLVVVRKGLGALKEHMMGTMIDAEKTYKGFLEALVEGLINAFRKKPELPFFMINIQHEASEQLVESLHQDLDPRKDFHVFIHETLRQFMEQGKIKPVDSTHFMESIVALCSYPFLNKRLVMRSLNYNLEEMDQFYQERIEIIIQLMLDGYKKESSS